MKIIDLLSINLVGISAGCFFSGFQFIPFLLAISTTLGIYTAFFLTVNLMGELNE